ncbi:biphenyl 2,3-dioxygenase [Phreatobacter stygius]|uniref:Biphenyl 2,3-dioxygenase n=1 Tax=Phreatobacter stygius TaxID=1940610 RepID=A0A4D7ATF4_9HYPH|nr:biphenyl 2,3-dioxygenase [Phreatobacter stygius]QCI62791.1 biphenyl 2,3-dioxygenase [Phreatobacter stygius]
MSFWKRAVAVAALVALSWGAALPGRAAGNLAGQTPIEVVVELGAPGRHAFFPDKLRFETGRLYKLVLRNASDAPHYFTSHSFSQMIYTRKVQVVQRQGERLVTLAEFKGAIREIEVYPGQTAEWWFVPVATGRVTDLRCGIVGTDGKTHADHGMVGEIVIE